MALRSRTGMLTPLHDYKDVAKIASKIVKAINPPCKLRPEMIKSADAAMYAAKLAKSGFAFERQHDGV